MLWNGSLKDVAKFEEVDSEEELRELTKESVLSDKFYGKSIVYSYSRLSSDLIDPIEDLLRALDSSRRNEIIRLIALATTLMIVTSLIDFYFAIQLLECGIEDITETWLMLCGSHVVMAIVGLYLTFTILFPAQCYCLCAMIGVAYLPLLLSVVEIGCLAVVTYDFQSQGENCLDTSRKNEMKTLEIYTVLLWSMVILPKFIMVCMWTYWV
mmetsp:Transcript_9467/g.14197  ORF Transcript_9467/g.14197 Transcript_9467/m.14197 type:complete len:211 (-) Transcript_9467:79-711(-)